MAHKLLCTFVMHLNSCTYFYILPHTIAYCKKAGFYKNILECNYNNNDSNDNYSSNNYNNKNNKNEK